jgi:hypothetical protein
MSLPLKSGKKQSEVVKAAIGATKQKPVAYIQHKENNESEFELVTGVFTNDDGSFSGKIKDGPFVVLKPFTSKDGTKEGLELMMGESKDSLQKVCGLMKKESKSNGSVYFSGSLKDGNGNWTEEQFFMFFAKEK